MRALCFFPLPIIAGICAFRCAIKCTCTLSRRARFTSSLILRTAALRGSMRRSCIRSSSSFSNRAAFSVFCRGRSQNEPMNTRTVSGVCTTLPSDHISAP
eukprot:Amastigsp_a2363_36.p6 type:complete len:100 gc:universal Amastigsp_a2363_36:602-901(+)